MTDQRWGAAAGASANRDVLRRENRGVARSCITSRTQDTHFLETGIEKFLLESDRFPCAGNS
ncbi:MAG: hypothetical protein LC114_12015 [Bryobacterales bacterium]|nr:hypothetical protein [Bryobacterales bacterium]